MVKIIENKELINENKFYEFVLKKGYRVPSNGRFMICPKGFMKKALNDDILFFTNKICVTGFCGEDNEELISLLEEFEKESGIDCDLELK